VDTVYLCEQVCEDPCLFFEAKKMDDSCQTKWLACGILQNWLTSKYADSEYYEQCKIPV